MKGILLLLIFLTVSTLRREEACNTNAGRRHPNSEPWQPGPGTLGPDDLISEETALLAAANVPLPEYGDDDLDIGNSRPGSPREESRQDVHKESGNTAPVETEGELDIAAGRPGSPRKESSKDVDEERLDGESDNLLVPVPESEEDESDVAIDRADSPSKETHVTTSNSKPHYDIAVVGGGVEAAAVLGRLKRSSLPAPLRVGIIEAKGSFATGVPYDKNVATPEHLLSMFSPDIASISSFQNEHEFPEWIQAKVDSDDTPAEKKRKYKDIMEKYNLAKEAGEEPDPPARLIIGEYLAEKFYEFKDQCENKDYEIILMNETTAVDIAPHENGVGYVIELLKHGSISTIHAHYIILATGHWYKGRFGDKHVEGYHESPWPAGRLAKIPEVIIVIFGSGLTAVDGIVTLSHRFGRFNADNTEYETFSEDSNFKIIVYSRSGKLPAVLENEVMCPEGNLTSEMIEIMIKEKNSRPFDAIFVTLKSEIVERLPSITDKKQFIGLNAKGFFERLDNELKSLDDDQDVDDEQPVDTNRIKGDIKWLFLQTEYLFYAAYLQQFSAEEFITMRKYISPRIQKSATRMAPTNAKKIAALIEAGRLEIVAIGGSSKVTEKEDGQSVVLEYGGNEPIGHDYFIDATGQDGYVRNDPRKLTRALLKRGLIQPHLRLFHDQVYAKKLNDSLVKGDGVDRNRIVFQDGNFYYEGDGVILVDEKSYRIRPRSDVSADGVIYATAPLTYSHHPTDQSLQATVLFAHKIVSDMEAERGVAVVPDPMVPW